jgi:fatty acid/phospholipid biosynthesis enzyme
VIIGHGISSATAIKNMILLARNISAVRLHNKIKQALTKFSN